MKRLNLKVEYIANTSALDFEMWLWLDNIKSVWQYILRYTVRKRLTL